MAISNDRGKFLFKKIERDLLRLRKGYDADQIHSFRTTTRRLQVLLEQLQPPSDRNSKKLLKQLSRIRRRAGRIRDIDVQLAALRSLKIPLEPRRKTSLVQKLVDLREEREAQLGKLLKKRRVSEIARRVRRCSRRANLGDVKEPYKVAQALWASACDGKSRIDEETLHRYRIAVKRARYAAEFAPKSSETARFIAQLKNLQNVLGRWHDWFLLTQSAAQHLGDLHQSSLVAALHNITRGKFREASAELSAMLGKPGDLRLVPAPAHAGKTARGPASGTGAAA
jgi:CHAD domain-containing protein